MAKMDFFPRIIQKYGKWREGTGEEKFNTS
jgi:hypothetical protein